MPLVIHRNVRLVDESGDPINSGNPLPTTGGGGGSGGGTSQSDKSSFTAGTTNITPIGGYYTTDPGVDPSDNSAVGIRSTIKRALWINLRKDDGTELGISTDPIRIDPTGDTAQPVSDGGGSISTDSSDGAHSSIGATTDVEATGNGTVIALLKRLRTLLSGSLFVIPPTPTTSTRTTVSGTVTDNTTILAANANRLGATIFHEGPGARTLYLAFGTGATPTDYSVKIQGGNYFEMPFGYRGIVTGVWESVAGSPVARITELT